LVSAAATQKKLRPHFNSAEQDSRWQQMTAEDGKSVVKAAKKALKKTDGGAGKKLSDLVSAVAKKTKLDAADVAAFIRGSKKFTIVGSGDDGMVALSKKRGPDTPAPVVDEGKPKKEKSKKQKRNTVEDDANDNEVAPPEVSTKKPLASKAQDQHSADS
jgi:hypothetical protein